MVPEPLDGFYSNSIFEVYLTHVFVNMNILSPKILRPFTGASLKQFVVPSKTNRTVLDFSNSYNYNNMIILLMKLKAISKRKETEHVFLLHTFNKNYDDDYEDVDRVRLESLGTTTRPW
jgi:pyruvate/2-oxoacid:ferredoxin oxidoreductase alpha subunit